MENFFKIVENFLWGNLEESGELCNFVADFNKISVMAARFIGNTDARMDDKGRVFFPAVFRRALQKEGDEALMIRRDVHQNCLVLYPKSVWQQQLDELRSRLNRWNAQQQMVFRQFVAGVDELPIDGNGRILIPKRLQQQISLQSDVRFIGMDDTIELWAKEAAEALLDNPADLGAALEALMDTPNS